SFHYPATCALYTLSLHDALPISPCVCRRFLVAELIGISCHMYSVSKPKALEKLTPPPITKCPPLLTNVLTSPCGKPMPPPILKRDRKSTRLNSSHLGISYAVFCL